MILGWILTCLEKCHGDFDRDYMDSVALSGQYLNSTVLSFMKSRTHFHSLVSFYISFRNVL